MPEERKILEMLASGLISIDEASELLDAIRQNPPLPPAPPVAPKVRAIAKMLRIQVDAAEEDGSNRAKIDLNLPLGLAKFVTKFLPRDVKGRIEDQGINLSELFADVDGNFPEGQLINIDSSEENSRQRTKIIIDVI